MSDLFDPDLFRPSPPTPSERTTMPKATPPPLRLATVTDRTWKGAVSYTNQLDKIVAAATSLIGTEEAAAARKTSKALTLLVSARARNAGLIVIKRLVEEVCALEAPAHSGDADLAAALIADFHVSVGRVEGVFVRGSTMPLRPELRRELTETGVLAVRAHPEDQDF